MELTIVGTQASYSLPGRANASYLVSEGDTNILLDIGNGSLSILFGIMEPSELDAVIISHLHIDHFGDIFPLRLYLFFEKKKKLDLYLPPGGKEKLASVLSDHGREIFYEVFNFIEINEATYQLGSLYVDFKKVKHLDPTFGIKVRNKDRKIVYSADTAYCQELVELSDNTDILLAEATFLEREPTIDHMTAEDAGKAAEEAGCKKLLLTHIWPSLDEKEQKKRASQFFNGPVEIAKEREVFRI